MSAYKLFKKYTYKELVALQSKLYNNPDNWDGRKLSKKAFKKDTEIAWAIRWHLDKQET